MVGGFSLTFIYLGMPLFLLVAGFLIGRTVERRHLRDLDLREAALSHILLVNIRNIALDAPVSDVSLVEGEVVIGSDYFKTFASGIRKFFGGEVRSLETLMLRARREAIVRMLTKADLLGARVVCNLRLETSTIGRGNTGAGRPTAEVFAYGTAICFDPGP